MDSNYIIKRSVLPFMEANKPMNSLASPTSSRNKGLLWELTIDPGHLENWG